MNFEIFVVDDDPHYSRLVRYKLQKKYPDATVNVFERGEEALAKLNTLVPDLILLDVMMPGIGGIETLKRVKRTHADLPVVVVSAQGIINVAIEAMKLGAYDYITKGQDDLVKLDTVVKNIAERVALSRELEKLRSEVAHRYGMRELVGDSSSMEDVYRTIQKALRGDLTVAIQGESGTGKELVARAIHYNSSRQKGPFVVVNSAAIPRELMESEFFGHEKGAFTGAYSRKIGKFEQADGGTLFLDEIGELDMGLQAKLLRALQNREITRVGGSDTIKFDARIISATNRDIREMIRGGKFREDLYYRLFDFPILLPPLRDRGQDPLLLAQHFLRDYVKQYPEFKGKTLSSDARRAVLDYNWPGNVRELKSAIERAVLLSDDAEIEPGDLMLDRHAHIDPWTERSGLGDGAVRNSIGQDDVRLPYPPASGAPAPAGIDFERGGELVTLEEMKKQAIEIAYDRFEGNVDKAAVELGIGRATMYRLLKKYGITGE
ncbi:MAG: sigma-54 dependent transcriptional regulator [Bacteroidota bacterium]